MDDLTYTTVSLDQARFATNYLFDVGLCLPKFSLIASYYHLAFKTKPKLRIALYVVTAFVATGAAFTFFADTFWCDPILR